MFKSFSFGVVLGLFGVAGLLYTFPAVDQARERSMTTVRPNGGINESFHVNLPIDRVLAGRDDLENSIPPGLDWPDYDFLSGTQLEIFKVRNSEEKVIGVASRMVGTAEQPFVEWAVHLPARGTMYFLLPDNTNESGVRAGSMRAGTREFKALSGEATERYVASDEASNSGVSGRLELVTSLVSPRVKIEPDEGEEQ